MQVLLNKDATTDRGRMVSPSSFVAKRGSDNKNNNRTCTAVTKGHFMLSRHMVVGLTVWLPRFGGNSPEG